MKPKYTECFPRPKYKVFKVSVPSFVLTLFDFQETLYPENHEVFLEMYDNDKLSTFYLTTKDLTEKDFDSSITSSEGFKLTKVENGKFTDGFLYTLTIFDEFIELSC